MNDVRPLPLKTREIHNNHMDSTVWNEFEFRSDDIIVATWAKSGTTWTQQIVGQLIFAGDPDLRAGDLSPWLDLRLMPREAKFPLLDAQTHRRFIKTHLPLDAFVFRPDVKHIYVARDGRDAVWSLHNHYLNFTDEIIDLFNNGPDRAGTPVVRPSDDPHAFYRNWFNGGDSPPWSLWENIRSWWEYRDLPNIRLVHFNDLRRDPEGEIRAIADFLEIEVPADRWPAILEYCSFSFMKANADKAAPLGGQIFKGGGKTFINKGTNGRWRDVLTASEVAAYEERALDELGPECARWLADGGKS